MVPTPSIDNVDMVVVPTPCSDNVYVVEVTTICVDDDDVPTSLC